MPPERLAVSGPPTVATSSVRAVDRPEGAAEALRESVERRCQLLLGVGGAQARQEVGADVLDLPAEGLPRLLGLVLAVAREVPLRVLDLPQVAVDRLQITLDAREGDRRRRQPAELRDLLLDVRPRIAYGGLRLVRRLATPGEQRQRDGTSAERLHAMTLRRARGGELIRSR